MRGQRASIVLAGVLVFVEAGAGHVLCVFRDDLGSSKRVEATQSFFEAIPWDYWSQ